jgi:hypothetical protein
VSNIFFWRLLYGIFYQWYFSYFCINM